MTTIRKPTDLDLAGGLTCTCDAWNRLIEVKQGQNTIGKYEYDPDASGNRRVKRHQDTDAPVLRDENTDQDGECDDERLYYCTDANMNMACVVEDAGDAVGRCLYEARGKAKLTGGGAPT